MSVRFLSWGAFLAVVSCLVGCTNGKGDQEPDGSADTGLSDEGVVEKESEIETESDSNPENTTAEHDTTIEDETDDTDTYSGVESDAGTSDDVYGTVEGWAYLAGQSEHDGVLVTLNDTTGFSDVTDSSGYFVIEEIPPNAYTVTAALAGYEEQTSDMFWEQELG